MKYTRKIKRLIVIIIVMATLVVNVFPQNVYANNNSSNSSILTDLIDIKIARTTLTPNTRKDWDKAFANGIVWWGFFHIAVEKHIRDKNGGLEPRELKIAGAGRYGKDGRADIIKKANGLIYIWDVKTAANGYYPKSKGHVKQVEKYVKAKEDHRTGPNNVIANDSFNITVPASGAVYKVTYSNSLFNDGLIFYRFDYLGKPDEAVAGVIFGDGESDPVPDGIRINWRKVATYVAIASAITAAGVAANSDSVRASLVTYSTDFLTKLGTAFGKAGITLGGTTFGVFTSSGIVMAEENSENIDFQAINDAVYDYETALETLVGLDLMDELVESLGGVDSDEIDELIKGIQDENDEYKDASEAQPPRDPLIIDLLRPGIDLCSLEDGVNFDLDNNGFAEKTAWIGTEDGFLALDRNGNKIIDNGGELFGDQVVIGEGRISSSGFEALAVLDENSDLVIDEKDVFFDKLLVWVDLNHNGYSEVNELNSLDFYEIKEIHLEYTEGSIVDESTGTMMTEFAKVIFQDGSESTISEFWFPINSSDTTHGDAITAGNVPSIEQAIENDETGILFDLVNQFIDSKNIASKKYYLRKILFFITKSNDIESNSRGGNIDARELHVIEQFMGRDFNGVGGSNPNSNAAYILKDMYIDIENYYYNILNLYTEFGGYKTLMFEYKDENGNVKLDVTSLVYELNCFIEQGKEMETLIFDLGIYLKSYDDINGTNYFKDFYDYYKGVSDDFSRSINLAMYNNTYIGTEGNDVHRGTSQNEFMFGEAGNDTLRGEAGIDIIYGGTGEDSLYGNMDNDHLYGGEGNDLLDGGSGNDILEDESGNDTYIFGKYYGNDTIIDNGGSNTLQFTSLSSKDILVNGVNEYDIEIRIKDTSDSLVIKNFRESEELADYTLKFSDKTMHCTDENSPFRKIYGSNSNDILKAIVDGSIINAFGGDDTVFGSKGSDVIYGNEGNDTINAGDENDVISGGIGDDVILGEAGDDIIFGEAGDDIIDSGTGNDYIYGGAGNDTFIFNKDYGMDIIEDNEGISTVRLGDDLTLSDVSIFNSGSEAIIRINDTKDMCILSGYGLSPDNYIIMVGEQTINIKDVITDIDTSTSTDDGTNIETSTSTDVNENVEIGTATDADTNNADTNNQGTNNEMGTSIDNGTSTLMNFVFIKGTVNSDAIFAESGNNIITSDAQYDYIVGGGDNDMIFGDNDTDRILAGLGNDTIFGGEGNDQLYGEDGNDFIYDGMGNDYLNGGIGNDSIVFGSGSDFVEDEAGDDTYYFNLGAGNDSIMDKEGSNTIIFGDGLNASGVKAYRQNWNDLLITFGGVDDTLTIKNYCIDEAARDFKLVFPDGVCCVATDKDSVLRNIYDTVATEYMPTIYTDGITIISSGGNDELVGSEGSDTLIGGDGNNRIIGNGGNDSLEGGKGKDYLNGGMGLDAYIYKAGYGTDTICDSKGSNVIEISGYAVSQAKAYRTNWNDVTIVLDGSNEAGLTNDLADKIVIEGFFASDANRNFNLSFDGYVILATDNKSPLRTIYGTSNGDYMQGFDNGKVTMYGGEGNDTLNGSKASDSLYGGNGDDRVLGGEGNDTLEGQTGNDTLEGGTGNDTYIFNSGTGADIIKDNQGVNTLNFKEGFDKASLKAYRTNWNNLTITFDGIEDKITIEGYFTSEENRKFDVTFADGSRFGYADLGNPINQVRITDGDDWMGSWSDKGISINGIAGNDTLEGGAGNDILIGGIGNDSLKGGIGDDVYIFDLGDGNDSLYDVNGVNQVIFNNISLEGTSFTAVSEGGAVNLMITVIDTNEVITIRGYNQQNFIFKFSNGVTGSISVTDNETTFINKTE